MTREVIWASCDSPEHRRYVELTANKKAARMNKAGAKVEAQYQELVGDFWQDVQR